MQVRLSEGCHGRFFILVDFKDCQEFCNHEQVFDLLWEFEEFQLSTLILGSGLAGDELANSRAVDVGNVFKIEDDVLAVITQQMADSIAQLDASLTDCDPAVKFKDDDIAD